MQSRWPRSARAAGIRKGGEEEGGKVGGAESCIHGGGVCTRHLGPPACLISHHSRDLHAVQKHDVTAHEITPADDDDEEGGCFLPPLTLLLRRGGVGRLFSFPRLVSLTVTAALPILVLPCHFISRRLLLPSLLPLPFVMLVLLAAVFVCDLPTRGDRMMTFRGVVTLLLLLLLLLPLLLSPVTRILSGLLPYPALPLPLPLLLLLLLLLL